MPAHTPVAVLVCFQGDGLMMTETNGKAVERRCCMTATGLMEILAGNLFDVFILNMTAKAVSLPKFMIVAYASNIPTCLIQARDDAYMLTNECSVLTKCDEFNSDPTTTSIRYKPPERRDKQMDR